MVKRSSNKTHKYNRTVITLSLMALFAFVVILAVQRLYSNARSDCYSNMRRQAERISETLETQLEDDRANLTNVADAIGRNIGDEEFCITLMHLLNGTGLITELQLLMPDNTVVTADGRFELKSNTTFSDEAAAGEYITGLVTDLIEPDMRVIRSSVKIMDGNDTTAVLFGVMHPSDIQLFVDGLVSSPRTSIYVIEGSSGDLIVDTKHDEPGNIHDFACRKFIDGYSAEKLFSDLRAGNDGYTALISQSLGEPAYLSYVSTNINDWRIGLSMAESFAFSEAIMLRNRMLFVVILTASVMAVYILVTLREGHRLSARRSVSSEVRRMLLELSRDHDALYTSLGCVHRYTGARTVILSDTSGKYLSIYPKEAAESIESDQIHRFSDRLISVSLKSRIYAGTVKTDRILAKSDPELLSFMKSKGISSIAFAVSRDKEDQIIVLIAIDPRSKNTASMLGDTAPAYAIALYSRSYLYRTESDAVTDSLTGVYNRHGFSRDIDGLRLALPDVFCCVYIDVNGLHSYNNKYGHDAGDAMLNAVANAICAEFHDARVYRIGGDEFAVFAEGVTAEEANFRLERVHTAVGTEGYHISAGVATSKDLSSIRDIIAAAERQMMTRKAEYYRDRSSTDSLNTVSHNAVTASTGSAELDSCILQMSIRYIGIFYVDLIKDKATPLLGPSYFSDYVKKYGVFEEVLKHYVKDLVEPNHRVRFLDILDRAKLKKRLTDGGSVSVSYTRADGENVLLTVYSAGSSSDSVWVFERR